MTHATPVGRETAKIDDIEALAAWSARHLLVVGSHAYKSNCIAPEERRRFAVVEAGSGDTRLMHWPEAWSCADALRAITGSSKTRSCAAVEANALLASADPADPNLTEKQRKQGCLGYPALNFVGAAMDPAGTVWVGARAPLLERTDTDSEAHHAALLRLRAGSAESLGFDQLRRLNRRNQGIRDLSACRYWLWIVAGSPLGSSAPFALYRLAWADLNGGSERVESEFVRALPNSVEGFALTETRA